jgi:5,10-methylenetetrahydromethanopterin reductase
VRAEQDGWTGLSFSDSQNIRPEVYVAMTVAATATSRLRVAVDVTNPITRHAAVTASAITTLAVESGGRAELGVGRGDSSLGYLGMSPAPPQALFEYLDDVTRLLRGESVSLDRTAVSSTRRLSPALPLGDAPLTSRIEWLGEHRQVAPVPVFAAASGPKVLAGAARHVDLVMLAVGADPARIGWALQVVRASNPAVRVGAYVSVIVDDDFQRGARLASGNLAVMGRFSAMHGKVNGQVRESERRAMEDIAKQYRMTAHGLDRNDAAAYTQPLAEHFAIIGPAGYCHDRLDELEALGLSRFCIVGAPPDTGEAGGDSNRRFVHEVLACRAS